MIEHLLHRYEQEIAATAERWEDLDNAPERAFIRGTQIGALFLEQSLREAIDVGEEKGDLALALEDLAADLTRRATYEKEAIAEADNIPTKLGYIKVLEQGAREIQSAAEEEWRIECDEV